MIRTIPKISTPTTLVTGQTVSDTIWNGYKDFVGWLHESGQLVLGVGSDYINAAVRPVLGSAEDSLGLFQMILRTDFVNYHTITMPPGYSKLVLQYSVKCLFESNLGIQVGWFVPIGQEIEISINSGGGDQRLALFTTADAVLSGYGVTGDNIIFISPNTLDDGFIQADIEPVLASEFTQVRNAYLKIRIRYNAPLFVPVGTTTFQIVPPPSSGPYIDGVAAMQLYLIPDCNIENF